MAAKQSKGHRAPTRGQSMKLFYIALAVVAVLGIGAILFARSQSAGMVTEPIDMSEIGGAEDLIRTAQGVKLGEDSAPVQIHVFSDYMCPACGAWSGQIEPLLKPEFIETGKVQLTYYDFPLGGNHKYSFIASRAARCAGDQSRFWEYHDQLFARQSQWSYSASVPTGEFMDIAQSLGLDMGQFESCLRSDAHAEVVTANRMLGETLGVGATPTVFVNGRQLREWSNYEAVRAAIQAGGGA